MSVVKSATSSLKSSAKKKIRRAVPTFETPEIRKEPSSIAKSAMGQITGSPKSDKPSPIVEAMMQKTGKKQEELTQEDVQKAFKDYSAKKKRLEQLNEEIEMHRRRRLQKEQEQDQVEQEEKAMKKKQTEQKAFVAPKGVKKKGSTHGVPQKSKNPEMQKKKG